jgi:hypothetical protein
MTAPRRTNQSFNNNIIVIKCKSSMLASRTAASCSVWPKCNRVGIRALEESRHFSDHNTFNQPNAHANATKENQNNPDFLTATNTPSTNIPATSVYNTRVSADMLAQQHAYEHKTETSLTDLRQHRHQAATSLAPLSREPTRTYRRPPRRCEDVQSLQEQSM